MPMKCVLFPLYCSGGLAALNLGAGFLFALLQSAALSSSDFRRKSQILQRAIRRQKWRCVFFRH